MKLCASAFPGQTKYLRAFAERRLTKSPYSLLNNLKRFQSVFARRFACAAPAVSREDMLQPPVKTQSSKEVQLGGIQCTLNP
jgi:hypothetical protein